MPVVSPFILIATTCHPARLATAGCHPHRLRVGAAGRGRSALRGRCATVGPGQPGTTLVDQEDHLVRRRTRGDLPGRRVGHRRLRRVLFYDHMIQHLMLIMVAAPLFAMGAPVELARTGHDRERPPDRRGRPRLEGRRGGRPIRSSTSASTPCSFRSPTSPASTTTRLTHPAVNDVEHLMFLAIGYLFWRHVVAIEPSRHPLSPTSVSSTWHWRCQSTPSPGSPWPRRPPRCFRPTCPCIGPGGPPWSSISTSGGAIMWVGGRHPDAHRHDSRAPSSGCATRSRRRLEIDRQLDLATQQRSSQLGPMSPEGEPDRDE